MECSLPNKVGGGPSISQQLCPTLELPRAVSLVEQRQRSYALGSLIHMGKPGQFPREKPKSWLGTEYRPLK